MTLPSGETAGRLVSQWINAPVADEAALALIPSTQVGHRSTIQVGAAAWYYDKDSAAAAASGEVVEPSDAVGRFLISNPLGDVPAARLITSGAGLTGGGTLAADRTLAVGAGSGITVNADDVAVTFGLVGEMAAAGVSTANVVGGTAKSAPIDHAHAHGAQVIGDGTNHAVATGSFAGFQSAVDKTAHDAIYAARIVKRTVTVGHADLTDAVNGSADTINIGAALGANSRILSVDAHTFTPFTGGGASAVTMKIGTTGDDDAIVSSSDVFAAAVDGGPSTFTKGIRPTKTFVSAAAQLIATFTPDGGAALLGLDAGSIIIDVLLIELA
jgi:hypothetical protein